MDNHVAVIMYEFMKEIWVAVFALIAVTEASSQVGVWEPWRGLTGSVPGFVYPVSLNVGDVLQATLAWVGGEDLDLYLYGEGTNLLVRNNYLVRAYSNSNNPENIAYTAAVGGTFYIRPDLYSSIATDYTLTVTVNNHKIATYRDLLVKVSSTISLTQINVLEPCTLLVQYSGPPAQLYLYSPFASVTNISQATATGSTQVSATLPVSGTWRVAVVHGLSTSSTAIRYALTVNTDPTDQCTDFCSSVPYAVNIVTGSTDTCICESSFQWNSLTSQCEIDCTQFSNASASANTSECVCDVGLQWNHTSLACELQPDPEPQPEPEPEPEPVEESHLNCNKISFATEETDDGEECKCQAGYFWSRQIEECLQDKTKIIIAITVSTAGTMYCNPVLLIGSVFIAYRIYLAKKIGSRAIANSTDLRVLPSIID